MKPHAVTAAEFIAALFKFTDDNFGVYFSSLPNDRDDPLEKTGERHTLTRDVAALEQFIAKWDRQRRGLFFCVSTMANTRNKANAHQITGAHSDIDFKGLDVSEEEIRAAIGRLRYPPTIIVRSGHGLHLYWLFKEPLRLTDEATVAYVEAVLRQLADHVGGDLAVCEVARLMRLPGTHNTKNGEWLPVTVEVFGGPRYELDDLEEWLAESAPVLRRKAAAQNQGAVQRSDNPFLAAAEALGFKPPIDVEARLEAMRYGGAGDSSIHSTQLSVSASLLNAGREIDEVVGILLEATRAAAGEYASRWNWAREDKALRRMCITWLAKHPPQPRAKPAVEQPERENTVRVTANAGEAKDDATPGNVADLGAARAKKKAKAKTRKGDTPLHITIAEAALAGMGGQQLLITDEGGHIYSDGVWILHTTKTLETWLDRLLETCAQALSLDSSSRTINEARKWIIRSPDLYSKAVAWDGHGMVPTLSGLIEPRTGKLIEASPEHHTTWQVPFPYDAAATCPLWLQMLEDAFADRTPKTRAQYVQLLQELLGMGLVDRKPKPLSLALVALGGTDTGKSGILDVLGGLFGPDNITAGVDTLEGAHALMPFIRRQPWVLHEAFNQSKWHVSSTTKAIISGNPVQINMKGGAIFSHKFTAPIYWGANSPPQFKEATHAIANRLAVVACRRKFDRRRPVGVEIEARRLGYAGAADLVLATEMPGVLAWAVVGLRRALVRGTFDLPDESLEAGEEIVRDANIVAGFVEDAIGFDRHSRLSIADCWAAFSLWWIRNKGDDRYVPSRISMGRAVRALNEPRIAQDDKQLRDMHTRYYAGIKLNEEGVALWRDAIKSEAFELKGRLADATSADALPYDDIPGSWDDKPAILAMRNAHDRFIRDAGPSVRPYDQHTRDQPSVSDPSPDPTSAQPVEKSKKPLF